MIQISPQQIYVGKSSFVKGILDWIRTLRSGNYVNILQAISLDCEPTFLGSCFVFVISFADQELVVQDICSFADPPFVIQDLCVVMDI
ncbi:hypothetical protein TNCT_513002 [Trichonephila clavata]|uniref:Uncharacterized protein n=1 Tax=Trichonephila clavata TaxID=2740835 RepID=A0A8X6HL62_TRICU|nr:hypothetical protein TNCT_513002 [Trichonephila clavata]